MWKTQYALTDDSDISNSSDKDSVKALTPNLPTLYIDCFGTLKRPKIDEVFTIAASGRFSRWGRNNVVI